MQQFDLLGIGNSVVDVLYEVDEEFITNNKLEKDVMTIIDEEKAEKFYSQLKQGIEVAGGSVANSTVGFASLSGKPAFIGKIKEDKIGIFLQQDMIREGLRFPLEFTSPNISTGCCTIFVEEDGTRTMCTFLGAGTLIGPEDIHPEQIKNHQIAYLEGYLWDNEKAKQAMQKMVNICEKDEQRIAFTLSDLFCVDRHRDSFEQLIKNHVDILFSNEEEICSMAQSSSIEDGIAYAKSLNIISIITLAEKGSLILNKDKVIEVSAKKVNKVVDTTGAGDQYAAGFLYGLAKEKSLAECGRLGSIAAAEVISHYGGRPLVKLSSLI